MKNFKVAAMSFWNLRTRLYFIAVILVDTQYHLNKWCTLIQNRARSIFGKISKQTSHTFSSSASGIFCEFKIFHISYSDVCNTLLQSYMFYEASYTISVFHGVVSGCYPYLSDLFAETGMNS